MTRAARTPKPVESFGPELFQALIEGSKKEIVLELPYRKAVHFRQRINSLRSAMQRQNHVMYTAVSQATVHVLWGEDAGFNAVPETKSSTNVRFPVNKNTPAKLTITPADSELAAALKKAGVEVRPLSPDPVPNTGTPDAEPDILETLMKETPNATG